VGIKINKRDLAQLDKDINKAINDSMKTTYIFFRKITPIDEGNARRNTDYDARTLTITGNYPYAKRLDTGWSKQAPKGMTQPSLVFLEKQLKSEFAKI
tara:strand:+ start:572 stop:865 length:294 start_codon:yes stop_codon:yes gene_type:complete